MARSRHPLIVGLAATLLLLLLTTLPAEAGSGTPDKAHAAPRSSQLAGVVALAPDNAWAVGSYSPPNGFPRKALVKHWDGTRWSQVVVPNPGGQHGTALASVSASGPDDVWAAGSYVTGDEYDTPRPIVEHWDGSSWQVDKLPVPQTGFDSYASAYSVVALSPHNVWVVGVASSIDTEIGTFAYIAHWDGASWTLSTIDHPTGCCDGKLLSGVSAIPGGALYAVGYVDPAGPLIEHRRGQTWFKQASPRLSGGSLSGVASFALDDAWAVGSYPDRYQRTLALHWNGTRWTHVATPNPAGDAATSLFSAVGGAGPDDIWAVGYQSPSTYAQPMTEHWDGTTWSVVDIAAPGLGGSLSGVSATSTTDAWAVGRSYDGALAHALVEHWDGSSWTVFP